MWLNNMVVLMIIIKGYRMRSGKPSTAPEGARCCRPNVM